MSLQSGLDALNQKRYQQAVELLEQFCRLPNSTRLVASQGLFTYLDDDEIATV